MKKTYAHICQQRKIHCVHTRLPLDYLQQILHEGYLTQFFLFIIDMCMFNYMIHIRTKVHSFHTSINMSGVMFSSLFTSASQRWQINSTLVVRRHDFYIVSKVKNHIALTAFIPSTSTTLLRSGVTIFRMSHC